MNQLKRALYLNLVILCLVCLILISLRFINTISFLEPFHSQTGGAEDTGFLAIWLIKNSLWNYNHFENFSIHLDQPQIFSVFHYNWLLYYLNGTIVNLIQSILNVDDLWLPTIVRISCLFFSIIIFVILIKTFNLIKKDNINYLISFYLIFGPMTGFWVISGKPDMFYIIFEISALFFFAKNIKNLNFNKILITILLCYLSWSVKQTSFVTLLSVGLFLLLNKKYLYLISSIILFSILLFLTYFFGPDKLFNSIFWQDGAALSFSYKHFFNVFLDSVSKTVFIYALFLIYIAKIFLKKNFFKQKILIKNDFHFFFLIGFIISLSQIFLSFHYGSAVNYYFIPTIYCALILAPLIHDFNNENKITKLFYLLSINLQIILIFFIFLQIKGSLAPIKYNNINEFSKCVKNLKSPILSAHKDYYRLPWITLYEDNNPILPSMMYENYYKNVKKENRPLNILVKEGKFQTLILGETGSYDLKNYILLKECISTKPVKVYIKNN